MKYKSIYTSSNEDEEDENDTEETPQTVMIHVPEHGKTQWNHIGDLDAFFTSVYLYHQKCGFFCIVLKEVLDLLQFLFILTFIIFLLQCVNYSLLFRNGVSINEKIHISDIIIEKCYTYVDGAWLKLLVTSAIAFKICFLGKSFYHFIQMWKIKSFFNCALNIQDKDLCNLTWHEIIQKLIEVQHEQQMCIHSCSLTELDIYSRILRFVVHITGAVLAVLLLLTVYDEDVLAVDHVLTIITILGVIVSGFRVFIPDENKVWCPEALFQAILGHIHYAPDHWIGRAHTSQVRKEFANLFQYKFLDVGRHGHPSWAPHPASHAPSVPTDTQFHTEDGKTELSLMRFVTANPHWRPPASSQEYLCQVQGLIQHDLINLQAMPKGDLFQSVNTLLSSGAADVQSLISPVPRDQHTLFAGINSDNFSLGAQYLWQLHKQNHCEEHPSAVTTEEDTERTPLLKS